VNYHAGLLPVFRSVRDRFINLQRPPASTLIGVAALALPGLLVEIDAIAVVA
jgi:enamine deaminase RidA (YjgF/YER057c/UK114 family)